MALSPHLRKGVDAEHLRLATAIGSQLGELPHPNKDIGSVRLPWFRPLALKQQPQDVRDEIHGHAQAIGIGAIEVIKREGKSIVDTAELKQLRAAVAAQQPGVKVARGYCAHCATEVIHLAVDDALNASLSRAALESIGSPHACWT